MFCFWRRQSVIFVCVWSTSGIPLQICTKFTWKTCLVEICSSLGYFVPGDFFIYCRHYRIVCFIFILLYLHSCTTLQCDDEIKLSIYRVSKNVPPLACCNFDAHEWILIFFGINITDKVSNQKTLYYATWNNSCFCTTRQNGKHENHIFHSIGLCYTHNALVRCLPERKYCHLWCDW